MTGQIALNLLYVVHGTLAKVHAALIYLHQFIGLPEYPQVPGLARSYNETD